MEGCEDGCEVGLSDFSRSWYFEYVFVWRWGIWCYFLECINAILRRCIGSSNDVVEGLVLVVVGCGYGG